MQQMQLSVFERKYLEAVQFLWIQLIISPCLEDVLQTVGASFSPLLLAYQYIDKHKRGK